MVTRTSRLLVLLSFVTLPFVMLPTAPVTAQASSPQTAKPAPQSSMGDMMKMHEKMMAEMQAADGRLDDLVKTMNAAAGDANRMSRSSVTCAEKSRSIS